MNNFLYGLTGEIVTPFDPVYSEARQGFNTAIQQFPLIIVYCTTKNDVSNAVIWSRGHCVPIRIRSGGHNYEGYSNGDCTLVIDISQMNEMSINESSDELTVQGGVTNKLVYEFVASKGYPFPGGTCPTVGVSGYALGGGWGLSCRNFGLGCDSLKEIELINYEGSVIKANRQSHSDLFWACRGAGGGNFGIIVSMTFNLPPKVRNVTLIEIDYLNVHEQEQEEFLYVWQEWLKTADQRITLIGRVYHSSVDGLGMLIRGIFYGSAEVAKEMMADFLALDKAEYNIEAMTFLEAVTIIGSVYPASEKFQSASRFAFRDFTSNERMELVDLIKRRSPGSVFAGISLYSLGGRVSEIETDDTAFYYRKAKYIMWLETVWEKPRYEKENREWIDNRFPYLEAITIGSYVNFPYGELYDYLHEYYGTHVRALKKIKKKYDPKNIFAFPQSLERVACCNDGVSFYAQYYPLEDDMEGDLNETGEENYRGFRYVSKR